MANFRVEAPKGYPGDKRIDPGMIGAGYVYTESFPANAEIDPESRTFIPHKLERVYQGHAVSGIIGYERNRIWIIQTNLKNALWLEEQATKYSKEKNLPTAFYLQQQRTTLHDGEHRVNRLKVVMFEEGQDYTFIVTPPEIS